MVTTNGRVWTSLEAYEAWLKAIFEAALKELRRQLREREF